MVNDDIAETLNMDFPDNLKEDINIPRKMDINPGYRYLGLVRLANYLDRKFSERVTEINGVEAVKFTVEGSPRRYPKVRLMCAIDVENPDTDDEELLEEEEVKRWIDIDNRVNQKARDIEDKLDLDTMIWSHTKRKENYERN